jgi:hypothetical protein
MLRLIAASTMMASLACLAETPGRWQFAGENQGVRFSFKIANECKESGAKVEMKLENTLDHAVTVSFRVMDPNWKESFERDLGPGMKDTAVKFTPEDGSACHPYVDEVYVVSKETQVTHADTKASMEDAESAGAPDAE